MKTILLACTFSLLISISVSAAMGGLSDLRDKKWEIRGTASNAPYLVFKQKQVLLVQECGSEKMVQKFNTVVIANNTLKLSDAGVEGACSPHYAVGFKSGSLVSVQVRTFEDQPAVAVIEDQRPNEEIPYMSIYTEVK